MSLSTEQLDTILALQLTVAWAGERADDPRRLGWWETDLTDEAAGGDLFARLLPKTAAWAGLELARETAIRADRSARASLSKADATWTLFHFGFELDEALQDRLDHHKRRGHNPAEIFAKTWGVSPRWDRAGFESWVAALGSAKTKDAPAGRKLSKPIADPVEAAKQLTASLLPLADAYPLPHTEMPEAAAQ